MTKSGPNQRSFMAIPVSSAISAPVVMTCTAVCTAVRRTNWMHSKQRAHVVDGQHGVLAAEPDVGERPARAFLGGALEHRLEVVVGQADGAASWRGGVMAIILSGIEEWPSGVRAARPVAPHGSAQKSVSR